MTASLVQTAQNTSTSGTTFTVVFGSNVTAGNAVLVAYGSTGSSSNPTVSGITLGTTALTLANNKNQNTTGTDCEIWYLENAPSGQNTLTVTISGSGTVEMLCQAMEFSGMAASSLLDVHPAGATGRSASWTSDSSGTLTNADEVLIGAVMAKSGGGTLTPPGSPWTNNSQVVNSGEILQVGYIITSATTAETYSGSNSGSTTPWSSVIASFNQSAGGTTVNISPATATIAATAVTPQVTVTLSPATVTIAAQTVSPSTGFSVSISPATVTVAAKAITPKITVNLSHGSVTVAARAITPQVQPRTLIASIAAEAGTDPYGNAYQAGFTVYNAAEGTWCQLDSGAVNFSNGGTVTNAVDGVLELNNNGTTAVVLNNNTDEIDIDAGSVLADGNNLTGLFGNLDPSGYPLSSSATLTAVIATLNSTIQRLQTIGIFE